MRFMQRLSLYVITCVYLDGTRVELCVILGVSNMVWCIDLRTTRFAKKYSERNENVRIRSKESVETKLTTRHNAAA